MVYLVHGLLKIKRPPPPLKVFGQRFFARQGPRIYHRKLARRVVFSADVDSASAPRVSKWLHTDAPIWSCVALTRVDNSFIALGDIRSTSSQTLLMSRRRGDVLRSRAPGDLSTGSRGRQLGEHHSPTLQIRAALTADFMIDAYLLPENLSLHNNRRSALCLVHKHTCQGILAICRFKCIRVCPAQCRLFKFICVLQQDAKK